jgi:glutathione peroxidase
MNNNNFYNLSAKTLNNEDIIFSNFKEKVVLIVNVASFWGYTNRDYPQLNELQEKYGPKGFIILGFPCNQFGYQEPGNAIEIPRCLYYVKPGNEFKPNFTIMEKVEVNGEKAHLVFSYLTNSLSSEVSTLISNANKITWNPISRNDIGWNFEKFLIDKKGNPYKRFNHKIPPKEIEKDIIKLLNE